jgi:hypothetical protein
MVKASRWVIRGSRRLPHVSVARALVEIPRGHVKRAKVAPIQTYLRIFAAIISLSGGPS